jgi:uroporphyrin-III C-methyltransferase/precorrin-2 dehydrogenase/sirohydrochlorin ferrochelatase
MAGVGSIRERFVTYLAELDLGGRRVVVAGAGTAGATCVFALLDPGADITVVAPTATSTIEGLPTQRTVHWGPPLE